MLPPCLGTIQPNSLALHTQVFDYPTIAEICQYLESEGFGSPAAVTQQHQQLQQVHRPSPLQGMPESLPPHQVHRPSPLQGMPVSLPPHPPNADGGSGPDELALAAIHAALRGRLPVTRDVAQDQDRTALVILPMQMGILADQVWNRERIVTLIIQP